MWATGIEDTFITAPHPRTGRTLDEYELTQHYEKWREDLALVAGLGVTHCRYGLPWHRIQPSATSWDFGWTDQVVDTILSSGVHPIIDLVHYGLPLWLDGAYLNPDYPKRVEEYAAKVASRYQGKVFWYTPLNEPRITAYYCGRLGWWPPYGRSWASYAKIAVAIASGIVRTQRRLKEIDPTIVCVHVDPCDLYSSEQPDLAQEVRHRTELAYLNLDLVTGLFGKESFLWNWITSKGVTVGELAWFEEHRVVPDLVGLNLYPMFSDKRLVRRSSRLRAKMVYAEPVIVEKISALYFERYGRPLMVTETASYGKWRSEWLHGSIASVRRARGAGLPIVGYTWWPLFALVAWSYREKDLPFEQYLYQIGLYDLQLEGSDLKRVPSQTAEEYRRLVSQRSGPVGALG